MVTSESEGIVRVNYLGWVKEQISQDFAEMWSSDLIIHAERLIVGSVVSASERRVFSDVSPQSDTKTGSIGFLDYRVLAVHDRQSAPTEPQRYEAKTVAEVIRIGIEPEFRRQGYGLALVEALATRMERRGVDFLVSEGATETRFPELRSMAQLGFVKDLRFYKPGVPAGMPHSGNLSVMYYENTARLPLRIPDRPE